MQIPTVLKSGHVLKSALADLLAHGQCLAVLGSNWIELDRVNSNETATFVHFCHQLLHDVPYHSLSIGLQGQRPRDRRKS